MKRRFFPPHASSPKPRFRRFYIASLFRLASPRLVLRRALRLTSDNTAVMKARIHHTMKALPIFDSCFSTEGLPDGLYQLYLHEIITELHEAFPESSFLAFNFREGEKRSQFAEILCEYDVTVMDYPRQYEGCPLLPLSLIHHFLHVCECWLSSGNHQNVILFHWERGGWFLAFLLASFLIFKKLHGGEKDS